ncbi:hypothetical protein BDA96_02G071900 [Sorghum bicolor]|uniref:Uncharacterized protein n=2 Tax=Sorghum bicolor TaxID=4558 RepID=A0A921RLQ8_SORBI|nr:uncharacterized protein LOC110432852 [Sorghum bicolor]KAG0542074.1 hypothetical protein BDA96_02G071900 [Sorghum bicolor]KXG34631.1 hypothetical protein SORBI_3002G070400 [Sorghum bicolor]|eukprot:XP_021309501.1 uncharacterized protein LOC110432852 [Sorghum bicolor]
MSRLQRSSVSFRRQGSSGRIWDDPLRGLDLKGLSTSTTTTPSVVLAGDPSPRVVSRSLMRHSGCGGGGAGAAASAGVIVESPDVVASASPAAAASVVVVVRADDGERQERPARRRRRISSAFCACMGHPPASHAQQ